MMKKSIIHIIALLIVFAISLVSLSACNNSDLATDISGDDTNAVFDPLDISEDKMAVVDVNQYHEYTVIKLHFGSYLKGFSENKSIDELLSEQYTEHEIICARANDKPKTSRYYSIYYYTYKNGETKRNTFEDNHAEFNRYIDCINSYEKLFNSTLATADLDQLQVTQIYILDGDCSVHYTGSGYTSSEILDFAEGFFVYYVTNQGDYVYYVPIPNLVDKDYLFPVEEFSDFAKEVYLDLEKLGDGRRYYGSHTDVEELYDLSEYKVGGANTRRAIIISCIASVIIIAGTAIFIIRKKKRKAIAATNPQTEQTT